MRLAKGISVNLATNHQYNKKSEYTAVVPPGCIRWSICNKDYPRTPQIISLVKNNPMHVTEIDFIAKQAIIQSTIKHGSDMLTIKDIDNVITRYRPKTRL